MRSIVLLLLFPGLLFAQLGAFYSLFDDADYPSDEQPRSRVVSRVVSSQKDPDYLDRQQRIVTDLGKIVGQTNDLFSKLMGVIKDEATAEVSDQAKVSDDSVKDSNRERGSNTGSSTVNRVFNLFDTISSIPFRNRRVSGDHVCVREITSRLTATGGRRSSEHSCQRFRKAQKCVERRETPSGGQETARLEECCAGWDTEDILSNGCTKRVEMASLEDRMRQLNYERSDYAGLGMEEKRNAVTYLLPKRTANMARAPKAVILRGIQKDYDWSNGDELESMDKGKYHVEQYNEGSQVITQINCAKLLRPNIEADGAIVHMTDVELHPAEHTLLKILEGDARFKQFNGLLNDDTRELLSSPEKKYTVFAIRDEDFDKMSDSVKEQLKLKGGCLKELVYSHIVEGSYCRNSLPNQFLVSLDGASHKAQEWAKNGTSYLRIGDARLVEGDYVAENGVLHVVDDLLDGERLLTWRDHLKVRAPEFVNALSDLPIDGPVTIFVPPTESLNSSKFDPKSSIITGKTLDLSESGIASVHDGKKVFYGKPTRHVSPISMRISLGHSPRSSFRVGCSEVLHAPIHSCNAAIYFVNKPIQASSQSLLEYLSGRKDLSKFLELIERSGTDTLLRGHKSILTIFAPTNDAFSNNEFRRLSANTTLSAHFVKRYMVDEPLCRSDLAHDPSEIKVEMYENLEGEGLTAEGDDDHLSIDGIAVLEPEIVLSDAIVYILEGHFRRKTDGRLGDSRRVVSH
ncbi:unnamed protein product, partial [Mesorhabditis spiculigera]